MKFKGLIKHSDLGLLILRIGIGISFMFHGLPKLLAGPDMWEQLGGALGLIGINFAPTLMGLIAALSEFVGGFLLVIGLFTRTASFFMFNTLVVATIMHLKMGDPFNKYSHALELAILFLSLIFIGAGKFALDEKICSRKKKAEPTN